MTGHGTRNNFGMQLNTNSASSSSTNIDPIEDLNRTLYDIGAQDLLDVWEAMEAQVRKNTNTDNTYFFFGKKKVKNILQCNCNLIRFFYIIGSQGIFPWKKLLKNDRCVVINCLNFMNVYAIVIKKIITGFSLNWYIQMPGVRLGKKIFCILVFYLFLLNLLAKSKLVR